MNPAKGAPKASVVFPQTAKVPAGVETPPAHQSVQTGKQAVPPGPPRLQATSAARPGSAPRTGGGKLITKIVLRDPEEAPRSDRQAQQDEIRMHKCMSDLFEALSVTQEGDSIDVGAANEALRAFQALAANARDPGAVFRARAEQNVTELRLHQLDDLQRGLEQLSLYAVSTTAKLGGPVVACDHLGILSAVTAEREWKAPLQQNFDKQMTAALNAMVANKPAAALTALREAEKLADAMMLRLRRFEGIPLRNEDDLRAGMMQPLFRRMNDVDALRRSLSTPGAAGYELSAMIDNVYDDPGLRGHTQLTSALVDISKRLAVLARWCGLQEHGQHLQTPVLDVGPPARDALFKAFGVHVDAAGRASVRAGIALPEAQAIVGAHMDRALEKAREQMAVNMLSKAELLKVLDRHAVMVGSLAPDANPEAKYKALCALVGGKEQAHLLLHLLDPTRASLCARHLSESHASPIRGPDGAPGALMGGTEETSVHVHADAPGRVVIDCSVRTRNATAFQPCAPQLAQEDLLDPAARPQRGPAVAVSGGFADLRFGFTIAGEDIQPEPPLWFTYDHAPASDAPATRGRR